MASKYISFGILVLGLGSQAIELKNLQASQGFSSNRFYDNINVEVNELNAYKMYNIDKSEQKKSESESQKCAEKLAEEMMDDDSKPQDLDEEDQEDKKKKTKKPQHLETVFEQLQSENPYQQEDSAVQREREDTPSAEDIKQSEKAVSAA